MAAAKMISSRYDGKCRTCKRAHMAGDSVYWTPGVKGVECRSCHAAGGNPANPSPTTPKPPAPRTEAPRAGTGDGTRVVEGRHVREWGSWREFVDYAEEHANPNESSHGLHDLGEAWYGTKSFDDALTLARKGWGEIRAEVDALVEKIDAVVAPTLQPAFESYFDVSGGTVDVGRFLDGEPECMVETRLAHIAKPGRVVSILVDGFYSASIQTEDIIARGVAIVGLVDALEKMQHGTEIWYETSFRDGKKYRGGDFKPLTYLVKLKSAEDMLDIDTLMFAIAHPSAYRRVNFAAQERVGENRTYRVGEGNSYGGPAGLKMGDRVGAAIKLDRLVHGDETANGAVWVEKVLSEFGLLREEG